MAVESSTFQCLSEGIGKINFCVNPVEDENVLFNPIAPSNILNVHVSSSWGWFLGIGHCCANVVVLINDSGCFMGYVKIPKDAADVETHFPSNACSHKFGLS